MDFLNHIMTSRDGISWSMSKLVAIGAAVALIYKFVTAATPDYTGFGIAITGIITALAIKYMVDTPEVK